MYLFISFFQEKVILGGHVCFRGKYCEPVKSVFANYKELNDTKVDGCIGILKGRENAEKNCYSLRVKTIKADDNSISIDFDVDKELDVANGKIDKALYRFACQSDWIRNGFYPNVCIVNETDFNRIRKSTPNVRRTASYTAQIDELMAKDDWDSICNMFEPLEELHENEEIWGNSEVLYNIAFACSKKGEPQNGLERDKQHLNIIRRYRDLSIMLFKRCCELEPGNFRYPSSLAYRYYRNVMELTKQKGRKDGIVAEEISDALCWLDKALNLNPNSIKDNYRKGNLILRYQVPIFKYTNRTWTKDTLEELEFMEKTGVECLENSINDYEKLTSEVNKKRYLEQYVKALYRLGCFYIDKPANLWYRYACCKLLNIRLINGMKRHEIDYIQKARDLFEQCYSIEANEKPRLDIDVSNLAKSSINWKESPMDILYRIGLVYLYMYFTKHTLQNNYLTEKDYGEKAEGYLNLAIKTSRELNNLGITRRNTAFISEKLAWYYIISGEYNKAANLIKNCRDSYIKNTYATALMLSDLPDKYIKAETALISAEQDKYNKAGDISRVLLAYLYYLTSQKEKYQDFLSRKKDNLSSSAVKLLSLLENGDSYESR